MQIRKVEDKVYYLPGTEAEKKALAKFPGLNADIFNSYSSTKPAVVYNLFTRLRKESRYTLQVDPAVKEILVSELELKDIPSNFKFITEPMRHQHIALRYLYTMGGGGLLLDPGMGKTKVVLDFIALMGFKKSIIVCPKSLLFVWEDEREIHRPDLSMYVVESTSWAKESERAKDAQVIVVNYDKAVRGKHWLSKLGAEFISLDEGLIKNYDTARTKALLSLSREIPYKSLGSGTLVNNSPLDVYAPVNFLQPDLVGPSYYNFRDRYAKVNPKNKAMIYGFKDIPEVKSILQSCSIVMTKDEWLDLPKKKHFEVFTQMGDTQRQLFNDLASNYIAEWGGNYVEVDNPLSLMAKLTQISNGFLYTTEDDSLEELKAEETPSKPKRKTMFLPDQPKIREMENLLTGKLKGRKVIIWFNMNGEYELITESLNRLGVKYLSIKGGEKNTGAKVRKFNRGLEYEVLLCQSKSVNYGITVLGVDPDKAEIGDELDIIPNLDSNVFTHIFYSRSFSLEVNTQQEDRSHRMGMKQSPEYYFLICNNHVDRSIQKALQDKVEIRDQILVDIAKETAFNLV